jgi:hypothetical protein
MGISWKLLCFFLGGIPFAIGCSRLPLPDLSGISMADLLPSIGPGPDLHRVAIILGKASPNGITVRESVTAADILAIAAAAENTWLELRVQSLCGGNAAGLRRRFSRPPALGTVGDNALIDQSQGIDPEVAKTAYAKAVEAHAATVAAELEEFATDLAPYLSPRDCQDSLVRQGISTLNVIAGEETAEGIYAANHIVIISDGIDAFSGVRCSDRDFPNLERSDLYVVTADHDLKLLGECFNPRAYNDFGAVRDYLVDTFSVEDTEGAES